MLHRAAGAQRQGPDGDPGQRAGGVGERDQEQEDALVPALDQQPRRDQARLRAADGPGVGHELPCPGVGRVQREGALVRVVGGHGLQGGGVVAVGQVRCRGRCRSGTSGGSRPTGGRAAGRGRGGCRGRGCSGCRPAPRARRRPGPATRAGRSVGTGRWPPRRGRRPRRRGVTCGRSRLTGRISRHRCVVACPGRRPASARAGGSGRGRGRRAAGSVRWWRGPRAGGTWRPRVEWSRGACVAGRVVTNLVIDGTRRRQRPCDQHHRPCGPAALPRPAPLELNRGSGSTVLV